MRRAQKIMFAGVGFGLLVATGIALATGSAQIGLHGGFWLTIAFTMWLESRIAEQPRPHVVTDSRAGPDDVARRP